MLILIFLPLKSVYLDVLLALHAMCKKHAISMQKPFDLKNRHKKCLHIVRGIAIKKIAMFHRHGFWVYKMLEATFSLWIGMAQFQ